MKIFCKSPTVNISNLNFLLEICIAKNFIWITLKAISQYFDFFCTLRILDFLIVVSRPNIALTNHTINGKPIYSLLYDA